jgi:hypothetical protein
MQAERINGSGAQVYDMQSPEVLVSLHGNVQVDAGPLKNQFYTILFWVKCAKTDMTEDHEIKSGRKLFDTLGNYIGYVRSNIYTRREIYENEDSLKVALIGRVSQYSILSSSVLETALSNILTGHRKELGFDDFLEHFQKFIYTDGPGSGQITSKIYMDAPVETFVPGYRIILVFIKQDLAAVIYKRNIMVSYYESQALSMPYKIYYMKKTGDTEKKEIAHLFLQR